jgi:hypothetical protein
MNCWRHSIMYLIKEQTSHDVQYIIRDEWMVRAKSAEFLSNGDSPVINVHW